MADDNFHDKKIEDVYKLLKTQDKGLSTSEADHRIGTHGFNEIALKEGVNPLKILIGQFASPLVWILLVALGISLFLGEHIDATVIAIIIVVNAILGFVQEFRAEKAIEALRRMASPKARVIRGGREMKIESRLVVPGDIIILETGDKIPADARLIEVHSLLTQEAALTGESLPVSKKIEPLAQKTALADRVNMVYSSTVISDGRGKALVTSTGMNTEVGKIATLIKDSQEKLTPLQKKLRTLGKHLTIAVIIAAIVVFFAGLIGGETASVMFLTAIALAVAAIPEGLPAVITISLAIGVRRMIKKHALVRKLPSVETLGSVNVICSDKTGTLTHNQMTVTQMWANDQVYSLTGAGYSDDGKILNGKKVANTDKIEMLLKAGILCNDAKLSGSSGKREVLGDPTEAALVVSAEKAGLEQQELNRKEKRIDEIPFSSERKMMTTLHKVGAKTISYSKGAPAIILEKCDRILMNGKVQRLNRHKKKEILKQNEAFASQALRVLGLAFKTDSKIKNAEVGMTFVGLQAMIDPPREEVKASIAKCQKAGIRVIMITGDQLATAQAIATDLGIKGRAIDGHELDGMKNLDHHINQIGVFARVNPEHKLRIVNALKKKGLVVAMTGDGVNDAPALKKADIGISMGITGTDVAKEASDMILTDDNFTSIVNAVEEGRGIFDNIRKFVNYLLSSNLGEITIILFASLFGLPLPLTAIQILWVNLVTDGLPATALGFDPHSLGIMQRPPRPAKESILSRELRWDIIIFGTLMGIACLILFYLYMDSGLVKAQTMAFTGLVVFELVRLYVIRSEYKLSLFSNRLLVGAVILSIILHLATLYTPLTKYFKTTGLAAFDWGLLIVSSLILFVVYRVFLRVFHMVRPHTVPHVGLRLEEKRKKKAKRVKKAKKAKKKERQAQKEPQKRPKK